MSRLADSLPSEILRPLVMTALGPRRICRELGPLRPVRVYVVDVDRLPRTILTALLKCRDDIEVIQENESWKGIDGRSSVAELLGRIQAHAPDVVIVGVENLRWLKEFEPLSGIRLLLLTERGKSIHSYHLTSETGRVQEISPEQLISMIRGSPATGPRVDESRSDQSG